MRVTALILALASVALLAQASSSYRITQTYVLGGDGSWDYVVPDPPNHRLFIGRQNRVMVVDENNGTLLGEVTGIDGAHGTAVAERTGHGFATSGRNQSVVMFDLKTFKTLGTIPAAEDADAIIYDGASNRVFTFNGDAHSSTVIDPAAGKAITNIQLGGKPEYGASAGDGKVYANLTDTSEVVEIDAKTATVLRRWSTAPCKQPVAMAIDAGHQRLFSGCRSGVMAVSDYQAGKVVATVPIGTGVDGAGFDPASGDAFASNADGTLTVIHQDSPGEYRVIQTLQTAPGARNMGLDPTNHRVFVVSGKFAPAPAGARGRGPVLPGSFTLMVIERDASSEPGDGVGSAPIADQALDGAWQSVGYGLYFDVSGSTLKAYELTSISCLPSFTAERASDATAGEDVRFKVVDRPTTFIFRSGDASNRRLHMNGAASDIVVRRIAAPPAACGRPIADTPVSNFDVFARTWAEQYGFFAVRKADWHAITARHRSRVSDRTTPAELFQILKDMIEPLEDAHAGIRAEDLGQRWSGARKSAMWLEPAERTRAFDVTEQKYIRAPLRSWCNGQVQYSRLDSGIAYLRLKSFSDYGPEPGFESGLIALDAALDEIFADAPSWPGLVIDVRINGGGADPYGLAIASRLTSSSYIAYAKQARSDGEDPSRWTDPQPSQVTPSPRPSFHGPVVELIGIQSVSAAETFTQALLKRVPKVTRVGENTQGVFSDVLGRRLPNGWHFGLPNERFVTDGEAYDGRGIAPDVQVPVFAKADLDRGRDGALEKALELLGARRTSVGNALRPR